MNALRRLVLLWLTAALALSAGCGFHLRGERDLPPAMQRMALQGVSEYSPLGQEVRALVEASGAELVAADADPTGILRIVGENTERRVLSLDSEGKVSEYELGYRLRYTWLAPGGETLLPVTTVTAVRAYAYDPDRVLATDAQETFLRREMRTGAVDQMFRRLGLALREAP